MKKNILFLLLIFSVGVYSQSPTCAGAEPICSGNVAPFPNTVNQPSIGGPGCLGSSPNPAWFYFQVGQSGNLEFTINQGNNVPNYDNQDVDFILWGPFGAPNCNNLFDFSPGATVNNIVDCSFLPDNVEFVSVPNAISGQYYMLLITNYDNDPGFIELNQTNLGQGGAGSTNCNIVCGVNLGPDQLFCNSTINNYTLTATFNQLPTTPGSPIYSWYLGGVLQTTTTTNTLNVTQEGIWSVSVVRPGCSDVATDTIEIRFDSPPNLNTPNDILAPNGACSHVFNLTSVESAMLSPALPSNYVIRYYLDEGDCFAGNGNYITNPSAFSASATTTIYVRVENLGNPACSDSNQYFNVVINCIPSACSLTLTSPGTTNNQIICQNSPIANIQYTAGGDATNVTVTGLPTGLTTSYASGVFTISGTPTQSGTFTYTVSTVGCTPNLTAQGTIVVNPTVVPVTGFTYPTPVCSNGSNITPTPVVGFTTGGTYSSTPGLSINGSTGEINVAGSTPGNYTITYLYPATTCGPVGSSTFNITITALPVATISYAGSPYCATGLATVTQTGNTGGVYSST
ncbi:hypothetical protein OJ995_05135, partial [Flavobacterium sp. TH16-21]|nr:hypothetical protein [Flavobacterium lacisediminis]